MSAMREAFRAHGIDHLSASQLNTWSHQPSMWIMEKLLKKKVAVGPAAKRGGAIEAGVTVGLLYPDMPVENCQVIALQTFDKEAAFLPESIAKAKERAAVEPTVAVALRELRPYGIPDEVQLEINKDLGEDLPPLIGYLDFGWSYHGIVVDLKTQLRLASDGTESHERQVSAYVHGTNREGRLCYCTPQKSGVYPIKDVAKRFNELIKLATIMGNFLSLSNDAALLSKLIPPDTEHWLWNSEAATKARLEVYGL